MCIKTVQDFINKLVELSEESKGNYFFRGHSNDEYCLNPSVFRGNVKDKECEIYLKVLSECSSEFDANMAHIDIISKMQHYGVPTRLLDVSTNALVALYFACDDKDNMHEDGCVYVFNWNEKRIKQFDSDTISILSSVPRFGENDKKKLLEYAIQDESIGVFNEHDVVKRLLHEIKKERPAFENIINPKDLLKSYLVFPKKDNPRIIRQNGAFIIYGLKEKSNIDKFEIITIPSGSKQYILKQLKCFGVSKATLHPELYKVAEYIKDSIEDGINF